MKKKYLVVFLIIIACNSVKVKTESYKISSETIDFLAVGESTTSLNQQNHFESFGFPKLEEKIKLYVEVIPYTKKLNKVYLSKGKYNQNLPKTTYVDSLEVKPELLLVSIADKSLLINTLNNQTNKDIKEYIQNTEKASIITSFVLNVDKTVIDKIKQSDSYYIVQTNDAKYEIALFLNNKKTETINIQSKAILAYQSDDFCWVETAKGKWLIGDLVEEGTSCNGKTFKRIKQEKEKSLYRM